MSSGLDLLDAGLPAGVVAVFTTRAGGVSPPPWDSLNLACHVGDDPERVRRNAQRLAATVGTTGVYFPPQVHGANVCTIDREPAALAMKPRADADAVVAARPGIAIGVLVADCVPVLLADPAAGVVAAAHAGRRGLAAGVLQATLSAMRRLGAQSGRIAAVLGPAICGACYEVPAELRDAVEADVPGSATQTRAGTPGLDLPAGAAGLLTAAGVGEIRSMGLCTACDERFFSYRRDGVTGRFAGVVMLEPR